MDKFLQRGEKGKRRSSLASSASNTEVLSCDCSSTDSDVGTLRDKVKSNKRKNRISRVWKYFKKSEDKKFAKCLDCGKEYKTSGNTSNLQDHLKRFHPGLDVPVKDTTTKVHGTSTATDVNASSTTSCRSSMQSVASYFNRAIQYDSNSKRKKGIDRALTMMIATDVQPFNIVENQGFLRYSQILDPRYVVPSKTQIRDVLMKDMFEKSTANLKLILKDITDIAVTCDCWTSCANDNFLTVTCHFIHNFSVRTASLATTKLTDLTNHSAQNIADTLKDVLTDWDVFAKTACIVTDNASTMVKACEILKIRNLPCFAHSLNLVVQDGLKIENDNPCLKALFSKCKTIVRFFKHSSIAMEKFKIAQNSDSPYTLLQETPTRWNSFYFMIERIIKTNDAISKVLLATAKAPMPLTAVEIDILKDIEKMLAYFQNATEKISGGKYVTISLIIPMAYGLCRKVEHLSSDLQTTEGKMFQRNLIESIRKRLFTYEQRTVTRMATILDPRFKKDGFQYNSNAEQASIFLESELVKLSHQKTAPNNDVTSKSKSETPKLFDFLEEKNKYRTARCYNYKKTVSGKMYSITGN